MHDTWKENICQSEKAVLNEKNIIKPSTNVNNDHPTKYVDEIERKDSNVEIVIVFWKWILFWFL